MNIWKSLASVDVNEHTEKKGGFTYLAWTWAWAEVKQLYPKSTYVILPDTTYADGSMEVRCEVTIEDLTLPMWLPVTDHKNKAITNPDAFAVNTARMRCLVKNLAMFGLGHYIYAGESVPQERAPVFDEGQKEMFLLLLAEKDGFGMKRFANEVGIEMMNALFNDAPKGQVSKQKALYRELVNSANSTLKGVLFVLNEAVNENNKETAEEAIAELTQVERQFVKEGLSDVERVSLNALVDEEYRL